MTKKKYYGGLSVDLETVSLIQTFSLDGRFFVYIPDNEHGGRIIASDEIISLVPSYNCKGSMLWLKGSEKAIRCDPTVEEVAYALSNK